MKPEVKEALEQKLMELGDQFQKNQAAARELLKKRDILMKSIDTINKSMEELVRNGSLIMAKSEAIRSMLQE